MTEVWPSLELYMHGGVSFTPYKEQFEKLIGKKLITWKCIMPVKVFLLHRKTRAMKACCYLPITGYLWNSCQWVSMGKSTRKHSVCRMWKRGKNYALVISTNGGLWRYLLGDTIQFTSLHPYRVKVSGRLKHYINAFGEEVIVDNTDKAIAMACEKTGAVVNDYTAAPVYFSDSANGAHEWLIEFEKEPADVNDFAKELDGALKSVNSDYEAKRHRDIALRLPILHLIKKGVFNKWLHSKGKLGGQHKIPEVKQ